MNYDMTDLPPDCQPEKGDPDAPVTSDAKCWANLKELTDPQVPGFRPGELSVVITGASKGKSHFWRRYQLERAKVAQDCLMCEAGMEPTRLKQSPTCAEFRGNKMDSIIFDELLAPTLRDGVAKNAPHGPQRSGKKGKSKRW